MPKRGASPNTRSGGQPAIFRMRQVVGDPAGNREQRRAAKRMANGKHQAGITVVTPAPEADPS